MPSQNLPSESPRRVTMRDIAQSLGLSVGTISRALRNDPTISEKTKARVGEFAASADYCPHPALGSVMRQVRNRKVQGGDTVALLVDGAQLQARAAFEAGNSGLNFDGCLSRLKQLGYGAERFAIGPHGYRASELNRILTSRGIPGCVLFPTPRPVDISELPDLERFAFSTIAFTAPSVVANRASSNHLRQAQLNLRNLSETGHRRIGLLLHEGMDERTGHAALAGAVSYPYYCQHPTIVEVLTVSESIAGQALVKWIRRFRLTALVTSFEIWARITSAGVRVPEDLSLVHLDVVSGRKEGVSYSGTDQLAREVGAAAADLVALQMTHHERGTPLHPRLVYVEGTWCEGETLGPPVKSRHPGKTGR